MTTTLTVRRRPAVPGRRTLLRLATAGSVDDGKSTLVGRLLFDTDSVLRDTLDSIEQASRRKGLPKADLALLTDGLRAEREQGITIDVAYRYFATPARKFVLADCPGHVQYTRNTVTGASTADVVVLLVDARKGVLEQTRRHLAVAALLRVRHIVLVVNKIDLVGFAEDVFTAVAAGFAQLARRLGVTDVHAVPVCATDGDNVVNRSTRTPWYAGPTVLDYLEQVDHTVVAAGADFRFPVQRVIRPQSAPPAPWAARTPTVDGDYRGYAGKVESGRVGVGTEVLVLPRGERATVAGIDTPDGPLPLVSAGRSVVLRLDRELDVSRGDLLVATDAPPAPTRDLRGCVCWLTDRPLRVGSRVLVQHGTAITRAVLQRIDGRLNLDALHLDALHLDTLNPENLNLDTLSGSAVPEPIWGEGDTMGINDIAQVRLSLAAPLPIDPYSEHRGTGAFVVVDEDDGWTLGAGMAGPTPFPSDPFPNNPFPSDPFSPDNLSPRNVSQGAPR